MFPKAQISPISSKHWTIALPRRVQSAWGCTYNFPLYIWPHIFSPPWGVHVHPRLRLCSRVSFNKSRKNTHAADSIRHRVIVFFARHLSSLVALKMKTSLGERWRHHVSMTTGASLQPPVWSTDRTARYREVQERRPDQRAGHGRCESQWTTAPPRPDQNAAVGLSQQWQQQQQYCSWDAVFSWRCARLNFKLQSFLNV